jgi:hypothetical protein
MAGGNKRLLAMCGRLVAWASAHVVTRFLSAKANCQKSDVG